MTRNSFEPVTSRDEQLIAWLGTVLNTPNFDISPASADASFRRYFRISGLDQGLTRIVMDAPPSLEDCRPFVCVAGLLHAAGLNAPRIFAQELEQGFLLLSDLGTHTFLDVLNDENADGLFLDATDALIQWQLASRPEVLPVYDATQLRRELSLFPDWYIAKHLKFAMTPAQQATLERMFALLAENNLAEARVFVHADFMPRNLMITQPSPGVLDFQDAVYGPISYDIVSLLKDAFISWEEPQVLDWTIRYWQKARKAGLPVRDDFSAFYRDFEWMGLQRHLRILGIFARIAYRDGKPRYLADCPRFLKYVRDVTLRYDSLRPLGRLLDEIHDAAPPVVGYSF